MTEKKLRQEFRSEKYRERMKEICGLTCAACGAMEGIEYHHIVPITLGGDNRFSNIVPLCTCCHSKIHGNLRMTCLSRMTGRAGRKKNKPKENYREYSLMFAQGKISTEKFKEDMGMPKTSKVREQYWFHNALSEMGIYAFKRYHSKQRSLRAKIWYTNGDYVEINEIMGQYMETRYPNKYTKEELEHVDGKLSGNKHGRD